MAFDNNSAPSIQLPPAQYDAIYFNQLVRTINTYFSLLDSTAPTHNSKITPNTICTPYAELTLVNGANDDVSLPAYTFLYVTGPTANFEISGFNSDSRRSNNGRQLIVYNPTAHDMQINNEDAGSAAENRIITMTGADIVLTGASVASLIYSVKDLRWLVVSTQG